VVASDARAALVAFCEAFALPAATSLAAKDCMLDAHPLALGVVGSYSRRCANQAVAEADLVMFAGSRTGGQVTNNWSIPRTGTPVIQIDVNPENIGRNYPGTLAILADARLALEGLTARAPARPPAGRAAWLARVAGLKTAWREAADTRRLASADPMRPEEICAEISNALPPDGILVSDTGHSGMWTGAMVELRHPGQRYIRCAGSMGWGFPGALGVKCARPDRPVVCFTGDGGFYYHLTELETAARYDIPVVVVVNNNGSYGADRGPGRNPNSIGPTSEADLSWRFSGQHDFAQIAKELGCEGVRIERPTDLSGALRNALSSNKPVVLDVLTDATASYPRAWTPGALAHV